MTILCILFVALRIVTILTDAVSLNRLNELTRQELLDLDSEVSKYYEESYVDLDQRRDNFTNYDEQLFKSIKAIRHTVVLHHFDFKYTKNETKWKSIGNKVDRDLCEYQLSLLVRMANNIRSFGASKTVPLSIANFFESNGAPGSSMLNGNFVWFGSYSACVRARIPTSVWFKYLKNEFDVIEKPQHADINGRYCVAHLRAKSWPKWDNYFEDRLTIKRGICLPESCHSALFDQSEQAANLVGFLSRFNLLPPFNGERYETSNVYCLPDEDSPYRQFDLGAKLFFLFVAAWIAFTIYTNFKYHRRCNLNKRSAEDIKLSRMKVDEMSCNDQNNKQDCDIYIGQLKTLAEFKIGHIKHEETLKNGDNLIASNRFQKASSDLPIDASRLPANGINTSRSSIDLSRAPKQDRAKTTKKYINKTYTNEYETHRQLDKLDIIGAFSIEVNLDTLLKPRMYHKEASLSSGQECRAHSSVASCNSHQLATVAKRNSSSNEALIKDLHSQLVSQTNNSNNRVSRVSIVSSGQTSATKVCHLSKTTSARINRRVNINILDGLKVIATSWIVVGHTMMLLFGCVTDLRFGTERMLDVTMTSTINTLQVVGLFYIITGCLLTYFSFGRTKVKKLQSPIFWLIVLVGRYVRLIPAYALVFWFVRHVAPHTGQGHGWFDYRTDEEHARGACANESWWTMWTMSAADIKIPLGCIGQAWYLSDDFRTLLVLPIYVLLLAKSMLLGYSAIFVTFVYSNIRLVHILREANIDYKMILKWQPHIYSLMADRLHEVYTDPAVRMSTYLLGITVGHLLYLYESNRLKQWPAWFRSWGMKVALAIGASFFFGAQILASPHVNQFLPNRNHVSSDTVVLLIPLFKSAMELSICTMILLMVTGGGYTFIRCLLASQTMKILSNISYAVFLIHVEIMYKLPAQQFESNWWQLFIHATFFIVVSNLVAFFLHLLFEIPVHNITGHIFKRLLRNVNQ